MMDPVRVFEGCFAFILLCLAAIVGIFIMLGIAVFIGTAHAQHNHSAGHNDYQGWSSQATGNCCNNQDCGELTKDEWRETDTGTEVLINGTWCPVKPEHFIVTGKSPHQTVAHDCIQ